MRDDEDTVADDTTPAPCSCRRPMAKSWEQRQLRKYGLEDVEWDAAKYCVYCVAERLAREAEAAAADPSIAHLNPPRQHATGDASDATRAPADVVALRHRRKARPKR